MKKPLRVLLAEDSSADADFIALAIAEAYDPAIERVDTAPAMEEKLRSGEWDVVISDYHMPGFGAMHALELVRGGGYDLPFIIASGNMGEDLALEVVRAGADDYVAKDRLGRLIPTIERVLRDFAAKREAVREKRELLEQSARLQGIVNHFPGVVFQVISEGTTGYRFSHVSEGSIELLELPPAKLESDPHAFFGLLQQPEAARLAGYMKRSAETLAPVNWEGRMRAPESGMVKWVNIRLRPRRVASGLLVWEGFMANITMSKEHEIELLASRKRQSELSSHLEHAKEQERKRIARELHDDIGGNLTAIKIDVLWLAGRVDRADPKVRSRVEALEALVDQTAASISRISQDLRPGVLDLGLVAAMEWQARDFANRTGVAADVRCECEELDIDDKTANALFFVLRETLTNIAKHAEATQVRIELEATEEDVELTVTDNGRGLVAADRLKPSSFGLRGMEERAAQLGGTVEVAAARPQGTRVSVRVPNHTHAAPAEDAHGA